MGRVAELKDIVRVVWFLLSEDAAYVTGTTNLVGGGTSAAFYTAEIGGLDHRGVRDDALALEQGN